ncbi:Ecm5p, partial [Coemansia sp. RSA 454]
QVCHHRDVPWCPFTVSDLTALLRMGEQLYFSSPEFEALIEWELAGMAAERQAQAATEQAAVAIQRQAAGVSDGQQEAYRRQVASAAGALRSVGLYFALLPEMERVERALDWCADVRERLQQRTLTSEMVDRMVDQAARLSIDDQLEPVVRLKALKHDVSDWAHAANTIIDSRQQMDLRDVAKLLEKGRNMDVAPTNYQTLYNLQQTALDLQARTDKIVESMESQVLIERPNYDDAVALEFACAKFGRFEPSGFSRLHQALATANKWGSDVMNMFVPVPDPAVSPQEQLDAHLESVQYRLRRALALAGSGQAAPNQQPPPTPSSDMYCVCLQPEEGLMIECESCREWYHAQCLNLSSADIGERQFLCPLCVAAAKGEKLQLLEEYPALSRVGRVVEEGRNLALVTHTLDPLVTVLLDARALVPEIQKTLRDTHIVAARPRSMSVDEQSVNPAEEHSKGRAMLLRGLLRALLGLGVNLKQGL